MSTRETKLITFYSYKGGAGRSSTTLNTLPYLVKSLGATAEKPLLLLDMDLDSAGMTYLLKYDKYFQDNYDVKQFLLNEEKWSADPVDDVRSHPLISKFVEVGDLLGVEKGSILFLGDNDKAPIDNDQMQGSKETTIKMLKRFCKSNGLPGIVLDSASGDQFSAILATKYATEIVVCMRPTMQFRMGTFNYLDRLSENSVSSEIILLPTVVPETDVEIEGEFQKTKSINNILKRSELVAEKLSIHTDFVNEETFGINEVKRFMWQEGVLYKIRNTQELKPDEIEASRRYEKLADLIASL